ncbi:MAG: hypothetical protein ACT4QC_11185 [Planctomycetaceae bacterium]
MKRRLIAGVIGLLLSVAWTQGRAEETPGPNLGGRLARYREERARIASPEYHLFRRAQYQSWQRMARLEAAYNAGIVPNRPVIPVTTYSIYPAYYHPWVRYYTGP